MYKPFHDMTESPEIKNRVLAALAYYDLFNFPLTREDVYLFMGVHCEADHVQYCLDELAEQHIIYKLGSYYAIKNDMHMVTRRENGARKATELIAIAEKVSHFLIRFPYVRGIAISGSLSKKYADDRSDIDFFIITAPNRLWIARTLLHGFKKLTFLLNKQHYFCMNYFVDESQAEIAEKNLFTATETLTLIPLQGDIIFEQFFSHNNWTRDYLPNNLMRISSAHPLKRGFIKRFAEALLNNPAGAIIDKWLMKVTASRWNQKTKTGKLNSRGVVMSMLAGRGYAKPNPVNFQNKIMALYTERVSRVIQALEQHTV